MISSESKFTIRQGLVPLLTGTVVLGSLWGVSEVALGGGLRIAGFPYRSGLLTGIGMAIMAVSLATMGKPLIPIGIGLVAVLVNLLVVPVLHTSIMCRANSCVAVAIESASLSLVAFLLVRKAGGSTYTRMGSGALAALIASAGFYFVGMRVAPCNYLLSFGTPQSFVITEGIVWAAFSAILLPIGYLAGERLADKPLLLLQGKKPLYYATAVAIIVICWGVSALAFMSGL